MHCPGVYRGVPLEINSSGGKRRSRQLSCGVPARSRKEFLSRLGVVEEEADESGYWLELIADGGC